jgi:hypothetical protein
MHGNIILTLKTLFYSDDRKNYNFPVRPSGNINVFLDGCPVSTRSDSSSAGAAPEVAPESRKANRLNFLLCNFCVQCTPTLLGGLPVMIADMALSMLV